MWPWLLFKWTRSLTVQRSSYDECIICMRSIQYDNYMYSAVEINDTTHKVTQWTQDSVVVTNSTQRGSELYSASKPANSQELRSEFSWSRQSHSSACMSCVMMPSAKYFQSRVEIQCNATCLTVGPTPAPETAIAKNLGTSSEPPDDDGQTSPPKRSHFYSVY